MGHGVGVPEPEVRGRLLRAAGRAAADRGGDVDGDGALFDDLWYPIQRLRDRIEQLERGDDPARAAGRAVAEHLIDDAQEMLRFMSVPALVKRVQGLIRQGKTDLIEIEETEDGSLVLDHVVPDPPGACRFVEGLAWGLAAHASDRVEVEEVRCREDGFGRCRVEVRWDG